MLENHKELIDYKVGLRYCADSEEFYYEILKIYYEQYETKSENLQRFVDERNWNDYTMNIHSLKSNSLNIGCIKLAELCLELEEAGKSILAGEHVSEKEEFILSTHLKVMQMYSHVVNVIKEYLKIL